MVTGFKKPLQELTSLAKKYYVPTMISTEYPPCINHAIDNAVERKCSAFQIFTRSPRSWHAKTLTSEDLKNYKTKLDNSKIDRFATVAHMPYLQLFLHYNLVHS